MKWRPIETAPTDGTPLLLFCPGMTAWLRLEGLPDIVVGLWDTDIGWNPGGWYSDVGDVDQGSDSFGAYFQHERLSPTHWMPLPKPPNEHVEEK